MSKKRVSRELLEALEAYSRLNSRQFDDFPAIISSAAGDLPGLLALHGYAIPKSIAKLDSTGYWTTGEGSQKITSRLGFFQRRAVLMLLDDPEWAERGDRETAHRFADRTYTNRHGSVSKMKTSLIGGGCLPRDI